MASRIYKPLLEVLYALKVLIIQFEIIAVVSVLRLQIGGRFVEPWALLNVIDVFNYGVWCQVNGSMSSSIDMFRPTGDGPDDFTVIPTTVTTSTPYQQLKCTNQIGLIVDGITNNLLGYFKCNTTIPNLDTNTHYWAMYHFNVINSYCKSVAQTVQ